MVRLRKCLFLMLAFSAIGSVRAQEKSSPGIYEFRFYKMDQGDQGRRFAAWARQAIAVFNKYGSKPVGAFSVTIGPVTPTQVLLLPHSSLAAAGEFWSKVKDDAQWKAALEAWESAAEQPYVTLDSFYLRATTYSPPLEPSGGEPRYFELRVYHSPTEKQLAALHERFGGPEIKIFHRVGIVPILYGERIIGKNMPSLTYLTPFKSLAEREQAWARFGADPEWHKARDESIQKSGQIVRDINFWILRAAGYSQIK